jgi:hypothetical protein
MLDDALFGLFSKQAVKSLKRNFADFYRDFPSSKKVRCYSTFLSHGSLLLFQRQ